VPTEVSGLRILTTARRDVRIKATSKSSWRSSASQRPDEFRIVTGNENQEAIISGKIRDMKVGIVADGGSLLLDAGPGDWIGVELALNAPVFAACDPRRVVLKTSPKKNQQILPIQPSLKRLSAKSIVGLP
jgi:hypothetical protein